MPVRCDFDQEVLACNSWARLTAGRRSKQFIAEGQRASSTLSCQPARTAVLVDRVSCVLGEEAGSRRGSIYSPS